MGCVGSTNQHRKQKKHEDNYSNLLPEEIQLLKLMYEDLASRSKNHNLTRQVFDTFFHLNGLWGQEMFRHFDKSNEGSIKFDQFSSSIDLMVKGGFSERCKILFSFYDVDKTNGISYNELVRMLCSYSKEDLKQMLTDENFLKTIDNYQLTYFFGPEKEFQEKNIIEKQEEEDQQLAYQKKLERVGSEYMPTSTEYIQIQQKLKKQFESIRKQKSKTKTEQYNKQLSIDRRINSTPTKQRDSFNRRIGSMATVPTHVRTKFKLTSNITSLVKRYAVYIFKYLNLDKNKDQIQFQQFKQILSQQQKIFNIYFQGFHSYVWIHDVDAFGVLAPQYKQITPWIEGQSLCVIYRDNNKELPEQFKYYLQYIRTTLFISKRKDKGLIEIKHMQGLLVEEVVNVKRKEKNEGYAFGIVIKHRDGIYTEKQYYFHDQNTQKQWLKLLSQFKSNSIYNEFQILEKIGTGNFSSVYRGLPKQPADGVTKDNKEVAIKVIQKFKLSANQNEVIKFQCRILELCHHPSIVKFYKQYNTKTRLYIVTEYLNQGDLFEYTKKNTFLEQYEAAIVMKQLIEAVHYLNYQLGLIHRDLKPENVMIITKPNIAADTGKSGDKNKPIISRVKLIDFGFAVYKSNIANLSMKEKFAGSPGFIAPEIFNLEDYDEGVDMFSLGIIMFFLLSGNLPFHSPIYEDIVEQTKQCNISLTNAHWMNISDQGKDLLQNILTFRDKRINTKQALQHPWFKDIQKLKTFIGRNKKNRYV